MIAAFTLLSGADHAQNNPKVLRIAATGEPPVLIDYWDSGAAFVPMRYIMQPQWSTNPDGTILSTLVDQLPATQNGGLSQTADGKSCSPGNDKPAAAGATIALSAGGGDPSAPGAVSVQDANQLSDKLAHVLGVSGDRLRQVMRQTLSAELPGGSPPDPIAGIAQQLGVSTEQVCAAFANPGAAAVTVSSSSPRVQRGGGAGPSTTVVISGTAIILDSDSVEQLSGPAHKLGVSPERLLSVARAAALPPPPLPAGPPKADELINRFAQNLGMSPEKVRAAITQVEGPNRFYLVVPFGQSS